MGHAAGMMGGMKAMQGGNAAMGGMKAMQGSSAGGGGLMSMLQNPGMQEWLKNPMGGMMGGGQEQRPPPQVLPPQAPNPQVIQMVLELMKAGRMDVGGNMINGETPDRRDMMAPDIRWGGSPGFAGGQFGIPRRY